MDLRNKANCLDEQHDDISILTNDDSLVKPAIEIIRNDKRE